MTLHPMSRSSGGFIGVDDRHDWEAASDGRSRLGAYLRQHVSELEAGDLDPGRFAAWCFAVATPPVMTPGYVWWRGELLGLQLVVDSNDGALVALAELVHRQFRPPKGWATWELDRLAEDYREPTRRPRVLPTLTAVSGPLPVPWPTPPCDLSDSSRLVQAAKASLRRAVVVVTDALVPLLSELGS